MAAALVFDDVRVDDGGRPAIDGLTFETSSRHLLVLGAPRAMFEAVSGMRGVRRGRIGVDGEEPRAAAAAGTLAGAPLDPPMPPSWTLRRGVGESAARVGHPPAERERLVRDALAAMRLEGLATALLGKSMVHVRRGAVVAAALATGARTIVVEDPLAGFTDEASRGFGRVLVGALEDRSWMVFAGRAPLGSPFGTHAEEALVVLGSSLVAQAAPAEIAVRESAYVIRVAGPREEFAAALEGRGVRVDIRGDAFMVDVGSRTTTVLFEVARDTGAVIVDLRPLAGGFV